MVGIALGGKTTYRKAKFTNHKVVASSIMCYILNEIKKN